MLGVQSAQVIQLNNVLIDVIPLGSLEQPASSTIDANAVTYPAKCPEISLILGMIL
jgi:hypothetical protein